MAVPGAGTCTTGSSWSACSSWSSRCRPSRTGPPADLAVSCGALAAMAPWYALNRRTLHYGDGQPGPRPGLPGRAVDPVHRRVQPGHRDLGAARPGPAVLPGRPVRLGGRRHRRPQRHAGGGGPEHRGPTRRATQLIVSGVLTAAFSVAFGRWVLGIIAQSYDRASLIPAAQPDPYELAQRQPAGRRAGRAAAAVGGDPWHVAQGFTSIIMLLQAADADVERQPGAARGRPPRSPCRRPGTTWPRPRRWWARGPGRPGTGRPGRRTAPADRHGDGHLGRPPGFEVTGPAVPLPRTAEVMLLRVGQEHSPMCASTRGPVTCWSACARRGPGGPRGHRRRGGLRSRAPGGGYGLPGCGPGARRRRRLEVRSSPGCGTTVSVVVPVDAPGAAGTPERRGPPGGVRPGAGPCCGRSSGSARRLRALLSAEPGLAVVAEAGLGEETVLWPASTTRTWC